MKHMEHTGIKIHKKTNVTKVDSATPISKVDHAKPFPMTIHTDQNEKLAVDTLLWAIGRDPETDTLGLDKVPNIKTDDLGNIEVNEYQDTGYNHISAIGDVQGKAPLTPVAIAAGRRLANRLFGGEAGKKLGTKLDYHNIPSVVFSCVSVVFINELQKLINSNRRHPTCGSVGLTELEAREKYGDKEIKIYKSNFTAMYFSVFSKQEDKEPTAYKLICAGPEEKVVGLHIIGQVCFYAFAFLPTCLYESLT